MNFENFENFLNLKKISEKKTFWILKPLRISIKKEENRFFKSKNFESKKEIRSQLIRPLLPRQTYLK